MTHQSIALFCGSARGNNPDYAADAVTFGRIMVQKEMTLYYGGGSIGIMGVVAEAMMEQGGTVIGVAPDFFKMGPVLADNITEMIYVKTMSERKQLLEKRADAFVIFPGGYGTMDEFFEIITDAQLGLHKKPIIVYNPNGYYDHLLALLDHFMEEGFLRAFHKNLAYFVDTVEDIFTALDKYENTNSESWLSKIKH
ncbi:MAG: TIGR00730 family Rossman fold protein [Bacteroidales bacterium]|nr:TIGR00730 family Rossman fold protein [Bacteroidales bacterium]